jgi:hypothetical protein
MTWILYIGNVQRLIFNGYEAYEQCLNAYALVVQAFGPHTAACVMGMTI